MRLLLRLRLAALLLRALLQPLEVHGERLLMLALELELLRELAREVGHLLGREGLGELERLLPLQQVAPHLERGHGARRLQEELLRGRVVVEDERDVAGEQVGVLDALQLLQRHHHARVHQLAVHAHRERHVEVLQRLDAELGVQLALVDQQRHVPRAAHAEQREVLLEALLEPLDVTALLCGDRGDGLVRRERGVADGAVGALRGHHAVVHEHGRAAGGALGRAHQRDPAALDRVRRVHEGMVALRVDRHEDTRVRAVPHDAHDRARARAGAGHGEGLLAHRVVDEGLPVSVDEDEARAELVGEEAEHGALVPELADLHEVGQVEVDDGAAPRRVDEELLGERDARHVLLAVLREDARARLHALAAQGLQVDAPLREHGGVVA